MPFTVRIDAEARIGAATCEALAPEPFAGTGTGPAQVLTGAAADDLRTAAAKASCPMAAIALGDRP
jgi:ferredoxin